MNTILVTGGAGFIGSGYILYLLREYRDVNVINLDLLTYAGNPENLIEVQNHPNYTFVHGDIRDHGLLLRTFSERKIDAVVNFAAESHVDRSISDPDVFLSTNVMGTLALLNAAKAAWQIGDDTYRAGVKFLQISTDEVYGSLGKEGLFTESTPLASHSPYSASKAGSDLLVTAYSDTYKLPVNITRSSNNYGPRQYPEKLIPLVILNALKHKELPVYGDGEQIRDWLYVEDHCRAVELVRRYGEPGEIYNIGGRNECANIDIVKRIVTYIRDNIDSAVGEHLIQHVIDRKGHDRRYGIDPSKIEKKFGWRPQTPFEKGIENTILWYAEREGSI